MSRKRKEEGGGAGLQTRTPTHKHQAKRELCFSFVCVFDRKSEGGAEVGRCNYHHHHHKKRAKRKRAHTTHTYVYTYRGTFDVFAFTNTNTDTETHTRTYLTPQKKNEVEGKGVMLVRTHSQAASESVKTTNTTREIRHADKRKRTPRYTNT